jgi:hypothetical protein
MINIFATALAVLALSSGSASRLKPGDIQSVADRPAVKLDPGKSYMLVRIEGVGPLSFIRLAGPAEIEDYKARRAAVLDKAHGKWVKRHASWAYLMRQWPHLSYQQRPAEKPPEPIEPTEANLDFPTLDQENMFTVGPLNRFAKSGDRSTYLEMLPPGRYAFYGMVDSVTGVGQACLCMGSVAFEVRPGEVADIGTIHGNLYDAQVQAKESGKPVPRSAFDLPDGTTTIGWEVPAAADVDPRLAGYKVTFARLHPSPHFANFFGLLIDRVSAIPGVLAYERDKAVDLAASVPPVGQSLSK